MMTVSGWTRFWASALIRSAEASVFSRSNLPQSALKIRSEPGLSSLIWHEHFAIRSVAASSMVCGLIPGPTKACSTRPQPKIGKTIGSGCSIRSGSIAKRLWANHCSAESAREILIIEKLSRRPSSPTETKPLTMSAGSNSGSWSSPVSLSRRFSSWLNVCRAAGLAH